MWSQDGAVYSCGDGAHGRLGHGDDRNRETPERIQSMIGKRVVGATASQHSLLWDENGCLYAFGVTEQGRLGIGAPPASFVVTPTMIQSFTEEDREGGQEGGQEGGVVKDLKKVGFIALPLHPFDLTNQPTLSLKGDRSQYRGRTFTHLHRRWWCVFIWILTIGCTRAR